MSPDPLEGCTNGTHTVHSVLQSTLPSPRLWNPGSAPGNERWKYSAHTAGWATWWEPPPFIALKSKDNVFPVLDIWLLMASVVTFTSAFCPSLPLQLLIPCQFFPLTDLGRKPNCTPSFPDLKRWKTPLGFLVWKGERSRERSLLSRNWGQFCIVVYCKLHYIGLFLWRLQDILELTTTEEGKKKKSDGP